MGSYKYTITATWPVEQYFLKVIGRDFVRIAETATAAYFPTTDIYASRRVEDGALTSSNQAVFGPNICSQYGDPYSPLNPDWGPWYLDSSNAPYDGLYPYHYRILIPPDYPHDVVRVELFDPDTINQASNTAWVQHTGDSIGLATEPDGDPIRILEKAEELSCSDGQHNPCLIDTDERYTGLPNDKINLWWFNRIDENRAPACGGGSYNVANNSQTRFELFYLAQQNDGTIIRVPLAEYIGQAGDGERDTGDHETDMRWVSPGGSPAFDRSDAVKAAWPDVDVPATGGIGIESFEVSISNNLSNILVDGETGNRYLYLDVTIINGSSENGFEIWAGPPDYVATVPGEVNLRNVQVINYPGSHSSEGATVFGLSNLPMNSNVNFPVDIPLIYIPPEFAGGTILISLFDSDAGAQPPVGFYFDSIAESDWFMNFDGTPADHPDKPYWDVEAPSLNLANRCTPGNSCQNSWVNPPYAIQIPTLDPAQCQADPGNPDVCTPFVGGRLVTRYIGGQNDSYGWMIRLKGLPFLVPPE
ncbi:MAG: hypothetical protein GY803_17545 [Chloroflexi bacterium]|nr:hypothetical protein [Chloroflexota bacterium]